MTTAIKTGIVTGVIALAVSCFVSICVFHYKHTHILKSLFKWSFLGRQCYSISNKNTCVQEGIAVGRSFAMFKNYHIDGNKEMIAFGMMNIVGSCTSCYLTTGILKYPWAESSFILIWTS